MSDKSGLIRVRLGDTRSGVTRKVRVQNWELYITVNFFENDQPGEVFVVIGANGSTMSGMMQAIATQFSMLLQVGVPLSKIIDKMRHHKFEPRDQNYDSLVDALASTVSEICSERGSLADLDHSKREITWSG